MKHYIVYDDDGVILRSGICVDSDLHLQGENVIEGECSDHDNYKIIDGRLVHSPKQTTVSEVQLLVRKKRDAMLKLSDWTQMPDSPFDEVTRNQWAVYRQALRDLPSQYQSETDFANVVFPNPPE